MANDIEKAKEIARAVALAESADVYFFNGPINEENYGQLLEELPSPQVHDKAILVLVTNGGSANVAYKICKLFHALYDRFVVYLPGPCKSAGTLIAIGAHDLMMSLFSELGPLDVQLPKKDELWEMRSGLTGRVALDSLAEQAFKTFETMSLDLCRRSGGMIRFKTSSQLASNMAAQLFAPIYAQIDPVNVGEDSRDLNIALAYGERLARISGNCKSGTINKLVHDYPSHDFVIDTDEAKTLFNRVKRPSTELIDLPSVIPNYGFKPTANAHGFVSLISRPLPPPPAPVQVAEAAAPLQVVPQQEGDPDAPENPKVEPKSNAS